MHKLFIGLGVTLISLSMLAPAATANERLHFGLLGGLNSAGLAWSPEPDFDISRTGRGNLSGFLEIGLTDSLFLDVRGGFVRKAFHANVNALNTLRATGSIDYASFPVLLKWKAETPGVRPYLMGGVELSFKTGSELVIRERISGFREVDPGFDDDVAGNDLALDVGGGVEIPTGRFALLVEGVYAFGLKNIDDDPTDAVSDVKTRTFLFNVGFRF